MASDDRVSDRIARVGCPKYPHRCHQPDSSNPPTAPYGFFGVLFDDCLGVTSAPCDFGTITGPFAFEPLYPPRFSLAFELPIARLLL